MVYYPRVLSIEALIGGGAILESEASGTKLPERHIAIPPEIEFASSEI